MSVAWAQASVQAGSIFAECRKSRIPEPDSLREVPWQAISRGSTKPDLLRGQVAEWSKAPHSKCGVLARVPGVRIPLCPPLSCRKLQNLCLRINLAGFHGQDAPKFGFCREQAGK